MEKYSLDIMEYLVQPKPGFTVTNKNIPPFLSLKKLRNGGVFVLVVYLSFNMTESGRGLQIVDVTSKHSYVLDETELSKLLLSDDIKDLPVVVVSVAGAYRGGKSFLLNFFLRYLASPPSMRRDGSWLGEDSSPLVGFKWRSGIKATTMGVLMWSEPFITTLPSGDQVAVLLVDTQGSFDNRSSVRDNSTIFALSTLVSSVQIFNISHNIQVDDLHHLGLFTEYGKLVNSSSSVDGKAFQALKFLVRDWQFPDQDFPFGAGGGQHLLEEKVWNSDGDDTKEMNDLRQQLKSSFENVSCFLMPHPGFEVLKSTYNGNINEISPDFRKHLIELVNLLFSPENLLPKKINGEDVKARELFNYFKTYMELFNSDKIPTPTNIFEATVKGILLSAVGEARDVYEKGMNSEAGVKQPGVPSVDLEYLHKKYVEAAVEFYNNKKKMGTAEEQAEYLNKLTKVLNERLPQFVQGNLAKFQSTIEKARESYEKAIQEISHDKPICVHPDDVDRVHRTALNAAIETYDGLVKRVSKKDDNDKIKFVQGFEKEYTLLQQENDRNNKLNVTVLLTKYWDSMKIKALEEPPLSAEDFKLEHNKELEQILKDFESMRSMPNNYNEDVYKKQLTKSCQDSFRDLKAMNVSKNKEALQSAVDEYDRYMRRSANSQTQCMHPDDLADVHLRAICRALTNYRPDKTCHEGFDSDDNDEQTLKEILMERYTVYKTNNDASNKTAVIMAFLDYTRTMEDKCKFNAWWFLVVPYIENVQSRAQFHEQAKQVAYEKFFSQRRSDGESHVSDSYRERLDRMMQDYYEGHYKNEPLEKIDVTQIKDTLMKVVQTGAIAGVVPGLAGIPGIPAIPGI